MARIHVLPDHVINKIAAGEVIENTSSVVKELVENALDAGATEITIEILGGGRQMIRISDNGCGMARDDAYLCLERHATSKLRGIEDFDTLVTMGFRGEAVPSIASISRMQLITSDGRQGTLLILDGGTVIKESDAVRDRGTTFEIKSLFFNVPVRKKFQRSPAYDTQEIVKLLKGISLAYLGVGFQLISDGFSFLNIPSFREEVAVNERFKQRITAIFGDEYLHKGRWVEGEEEGRRIMGVVGMPSEAKPQKTGQLLLINNRAVRAPLISQAVRDGYGSSLMEQRHPVYCLALTLPGDVVDVNVHPQKKEVRLTQESLLRAWIAGRVEKALWKREETKEQLFRSPSFSLPLPAEKPFSYEKCLDSAQIPSWQQMMMTAPEEEKIAAKSSLATSVKDTPVQQELVKTVIIPRAVATLPGYVILDPMSLTTEWKNEKEGIFLLDQRRVYHRILYEQMTAKEGVETSVSQSLIVPYTYECEGDDLESLTEILPDFHKGGISIKEFGGRTFMIDALPPYLDREDIFGLIGEAIEEWKGSRTLHFKEKDRWLGRLSGRITARKKGLLSLVEAQSMLKTWVRYGSPTFCPLGKPILLCLNREQLDKFGG